MYQHYHDYKNPCSWPEGLVSTVAHPTGEGRGDSVHAVISTPFCTLWAQPVTLRIRSRSLIFELDLSLDGKYERCKFGYPACKAIEYPILHSFGQVTLRIGSRSLIFELDLSLHGKHKRCKFGDPAGKACEAIESTLFYTLLAR